MIKGCARIRMGDAARVVYARLYRGVRIIRPYEHYVMTVYITCVRCPGGKEKRFSDTCVLTATGGAHYLSVITSVPPNNTTERTCYDTKRSRRIRRKTIVPTAVRPRHTSPLSYPCEKTFSG